MKKRNLLSGALSIALLSTTFLMSCTGEIPDVPPTPGGKNESKIDHLIFEEIFYAGTQKDNWRYDYDSYIKIYNPTGETQYLDSLALVVSPFSSDEYADLQDDDVKKEGMKNTFETHLGVATMVQFPGTGKDYPIKPGESVLIAAFAYDHTKKNPDPEAYIGNNSNSFDLTKANFEWMTPEQIRYEYDNSEDNKNVPNMMTIYSDKSFKNPDRALKIAKNSFIALVKLGVPVSDLKKTEYQWNWSLVNASEHHTHVMEHGPSLKIPNEWVVDAVSLCAKEEFRKFYTSTSLDAGHTGVMNRNSDKIQQYAGKAVFRKHDGKKFVDTNNSTVDFEVREASLHKGTQVK